MGSCLGREPTVRRSGYVNRSDPREPLLKNDERQAVNNLLAYLEKGMCVCVVLLFAFHRPYMSFHTCFAFRYEQRARIKR